MAMADSRQAGRWSAAAGWARKRTASVAVALAGVLAGGALYLANQQYVVATSPARCAAGCVTDGSSTFGADPEMVKVERDIAAANNSATSVGPHVSVVLLDPFTYSPAGTVSQVRMTDELRGAYLAQQAVNSKDGPKIQLLLANEGTSNEEGEAQAVAQIESLQKRDSLVAVAGMGLSTASTQTAASALSNAGMAMFGALTTGDQFDNAYFQGFYQVVPDVDAQVQELLAYLKAGQPKILKVANGQYVALVSSDQTTDIYSSDLQTDFTTAFESVTTLRASSFDPADPRQRFAGIAKGVCAEQAPAKPGQVVSQLVLFAGREATLPTLIREFQQSADCQGHDVTIVTGSDANALPSSVTSRQPGDPGAMVAVDYADIVDGSKLSPMFTKDYNRSFGPPSPGAACPRYDPWAVATYNSVMAAAETALQSQPSAGRETAPGPQVPASIPAALLGTFGFNPNGQLANPDIPVYQASSGICTLVASLTPAKSTAAK
jgi:hypothetical protein